MLLLPFRLLLEMNLISLMKVILRLNPFILIFLTTFFSFFYYYYFFIVQHWEHLCECKSSKHRLLYRHTLAELADLVLIVDKHASEEMPQSDSLLRNISSSSELNSLKKKV